MTPKRRAALEWIREREPVGWFDADGPSLRDVRQMEKDGEVEAVGREPGSGIFGSVTLYCLTDKSRVAMRDIDIGREAVWHLQSMYPAALAAVPKTAAISLRNFINNLVKQAIENQKGNEE